MNERLLRNIQIKVDNGPESSGVRTQFLKRMVEFADHTRKIVQLLYYPPYHSKYNPIERCWGILEQHWNGAKLMTLARRLPLSCLLLETDSPVLGSLPGARNEPANLSRALAAVAEIKGLAVEEVAEAVTENARCLFGNVVRGIGA
jgi:hypothetical protein